MGRKMIASNQEKNDRLTLKWLSTAVKEVKTELSEIQASLNSTAVLQSHETFSGEFELLRADVSNLNRELELSRQENAKYQAELSALRDEVNSLAENWRTMGVACGKIKNQVSVFFYLHFLHFFTLI